MFASKGRDEEASLHCHCEQLEQSDFETGDHFSVVISGDFNVDIYRSLERTRLSFGA